MIKNVKRKSKNDWGGYDARSNRFLYAVCLCAVRLFGGR